MLLGKSAGLSASLLLMLFVFAGCCVTLTTDELYSFQPIYRADYDSFATGQIQSLIYLYDQLVYRAMLAIGCVASCVELGFDKDKPGKGGKAQSSVAVKADQPADPAADLAVEHVQQQESWTSAMTVLITFSALGAFVELGLGYLEAHFKFLNYGGEPVLTFQT